MSQNPATSPQQEAQINPDELHRLRQLATVFASAPHRLMFFAGASSVLLSMLWWAFALADGHFGWGMMPQAPIPPIWAHATLIQYGMFPMFFFGFLLTVFPRWLNRPSLRKSAYIPVFVGIFGGYVVAHVGLLVGAKVLLAGSVMMLAGYVAGLLALGNVLRHAGLRDRHPVSCYLALLLGSIGMMAFIGYQLGASAQWAIFAIKLGTFGLLLPVYFTVCHRMIPFFSANIAPAYKLVRPAWSLPVMWVLLMTHLGLELSLHSRWLWLVDLPLAGFFLWHWITWQPWKAMRPGILAVLHLALLWLPIAFFMYAAQSLVEWSSGAFVLGRAPMHALGIGFFGSMLVAMVTRVTQGHSGRPMQMGLVPWITFVALQFVVVLRIAAEIVPDRALWWTIAGFAWLLAFLPWVLRSLWIYVTPRADGRPD